LIGAKGPEQLEVPGAAEAGHFGPERLGDLDRKRPDASRGAVDQDPGPRSRFDDDAPKRERDAARDWLANSWSLVHRWGSGGVFPNFPDPDLTDWASAYHGPNYQRLTRVKASCDPDNVFYFHQSLPPASLL
jgi:hypothetical protein